LAGIVEVLTPKSVQHVAGTQPQAVAVPGRGRGWLCEELLDGSIREQVNVNIYTHTYIYININNTRGNNQVRSQMHVGIIILPVVQLLCSG
jgi:hypothetical protein